LSSRGRASSYWFNVRRVESIWMSEVLNGHNVGWVCNERRMSEILGAVVEVWEVGEDSTWVLVERSVIVQTASHKTCTRTHWRHHRHHFIMSSRSGVEPIVLLQLRETSTAVLNSTESNRLRDSQRFHFERLSLADLSFWSGPIASIFQFLLNRFVHRNWLLT